MDLHELCPVGRRTTGGRDGRRLEWFAEVCDNLPDRPRFRDEGNEPDVAATRWARKGKFLPHPGHELGLWHREVSWEGDLSHELQRSPVACPPTACPAVAASPGLPTFDFGTGRDGGPELEIRGEHPVIPVPMLPRWRHEIGQPVQEVTR